MPYRDLLIEALITALSVLSVEMVLISAFKIYPADREWETLLGRLPKGLPRAYQPRNPLFLRGIVILMPVLEVGSTPKPPSTHTTK